MKVLKPLSPRGPIGVLVPAGERGFGERGRRSMLQDATPTGRAADPAWQIGQESGFAQATGIYLQDNHISTKLM